MSEESGASGITERATNFKETAKTLSDLLVDLPELCQPLTAEDNVDVEDLTESLEIVTDFMSNPLVERTYTHAPVNLRGRQPINESFLDGVGSAARTMRRHLMDQESLEILSWSSGGLKRNLGEALDRSARKEFAFLTVPEQAKLDEFVESMRGRLHALDADYALKSATKRASEAAARAEESASKASTAAGVTADNAMSVFYAEFGANEEATANLFRTWAIGLGSVAGVIACAFLSGAGLGVGWLEIPAGDYVHLIQRGLVLAAFLALAGYLARQAHQHRTMGNWARSLAVQLKTFDAFIDAIEDSAVRDDLRREFASRVFGDHPAVKGEPAISASSQGLSALTEAVARLVPGGK